MPGIIVCSVIFLFRSISDSLGAMLYIDTVHDYTLRRSHRNICQKNVTVVGNIFATLNCWRVIRIRVGREPDLCILFTVRFG